MSTKYEYYITNDDEYARIFGGIQRAQTFTPSSSHTITSVKLLLYRVGSPGTLTVAIKATSTNLPSGANLVSNTYNGDTLTADTAGEWIEITLGAGTALSLSTKYAIVISGGVDTSNCGVWRADYTDPSYSGGSQCYSGDGGSIWIEHTPSDFMFEEWGTVSGWANISKINGIASTSISKVNGVAVVSISKINGVAV